jgi:hypothetical protein
MEQATELYEVGSNEKSVTEKSEMLVERPQSSSNEPISAREASKVFMESSDEDPLDEQGWEKAEEPKGFFAKLFHRQPKSFDLVPESHESAKEAAEAFGSGEDLPIDEDLPDAEIVASAEAEQMNEETLMSDKEQEYYEEFQDKILEEEAESEKIHK